MDFNLNAAFESEGELGLLHAHALLRALPDDFKLRSHVFRGFQVNPDLTVESILEEMGNPKVLYESRTGRSCRLNLILGDPRGVVALLNFHPGMVKVDFLSSADDAEGAATKIAQVFSKHKFENKEENGVWIDYSHETTHGVSRNTEFIYCPTWEEIRGNYTDSVGRDLEKLMGMETPWNRGRLMIWHGETGTGKTYAIRSLLMAWRKRFNFLVVTDPEKLAANPSYYYEIASESSNRPGRGRRPMPISRFDDDDEEERSKGPKRVLFILEDSADLIITESRSRHYDKIGKLLNITDGLIGQGREDLFLVSFNEDIEDIDKAFLRPGRCLSNLEFGSFDQADAAAWLAKRGVKAAVHEEMTLAELYAKLIAQGNEDGKVQAAAGFAAKRT